MVAYVELHCHSNFSLLDGASHPEALVERAFELGMPALALTDHDNLYGAVRFADAAKACRVHPVFGVELTLVGGYHLTLLVENQTGWKNLCALITLAQHNAPKGQALLPLAALADHAEGLLALSGCRQGELAHALLSKDWGRAKQRAAWYVQIFGKSRFFVELQNHLLPDDLPLIRKLEALADSVGVEQVVTNNVHYATRADHDLQDILVCLREKTTLEAGSAVRRPNSEYYLKRGDALHALFPRSVKAQTNTLALAERCSFTPTYGLQDLPLVETPAGQSSAQYLQTLCETALARRFPDSPEAAREALARELRVITKSGLANYFLVVWDIVRFARQSGIRCQGRGSAANSLVAHLLGISPVNPLEHDLVFERFLSDERATTPDIDIDFDAANREQVIQYVYQTYGVERAAMACTVVTFRQRLAIREVGKVLGLPPDLIDHAASAVRARNAGGLPAAQTGAPITQWMGDNPALHQLERLSNRLIGYPRHIGIHNGGMVITASRLTDRVPTEPATMPDRYVVQWDKDSLEASGLIKIDLLGLRMLSAISQTQQAVEEATGRPLDLDGLPPTDPAVFAMIQRADTIPVFQIESRAQQQVLPRMLPNSFADLIISISLIRPGPIVGNMVHPFLRRRLGEEPISYFHPILERTLKETLGVVLFQEQVLKIARDMGKFTAGQGELLRRALGNKSAQEAVEAFHAAFLQGASEQGVPRPIAEDVFTRLKAFGSYSFPKSHAAAFAVIVYQSAWLKHYFPAYFYCAVLNNEPMGFYAPSVVVNDARRHGISVLPVDVNLSSAKCKVVNGAIRIGLSYVSGLSEQGADWIVAQRGDMPFTSLADFCKRTRLARKLVERLILVGGMDGWRLARRQLLWALGEIPTHPDELDLAYFHEAVELPAMTRRDSMAAQFAILGLATDGHIMQFYRGGLTPQGIVASTELSRIPDGTVIRVAGQVVVHQSPPTAKGHHFISLEDEFGMMNIIVRPTVYEAFWQIWREEPLLLVTGAVQHKGGVVNVIAIVPKPLQ